ncbi:MAG: ATP-binding protein [Spirochaetaceae bacterium]
MFIRRRLQDALENWYRSDNRKPLVVRGARQTGKTTAVDAFGRTLPGYVYLNLERSEDRALFERDLPFGQLLKAIALEKNVDLDGAERLLFIDEVQASPGAIASLRRFAEYERAPPVVAAGSLLEVYLSRYEVSFPVGRVEYRYCYPLSFSEFLSGYGSRQLIQAYEQTPVPEYALPKLFDAFHEYALAGGMPEIASAYLDHRDARRLRPLYDALVQSFEDDAGKYARSPAGYQVLRHVIETAPLEAGTRVKFQGFGNSTYRSREVGEALRTLERAMLLHLSYPVTSTEPPFEPNRKRSPKLHVLDTGLVNHAVGLASEYIGLEDLSAVYRGRIAEHAVAQELQAAEIDRSVDVRFWTSEKATSAAEVDFVVPIDTRLVPVEVKSGKAGRLRSLHVFMEKVDHELAIRLYRGPIRTDTVETPGGKRFRLLNLPYFLASRLPACIARAGL